MMTEQEAKTKWCPMRRIVRIGDVRIDNTDGKEFTLNCIGSGCMMWREAMKLVNAQDKVGAAPILVPIAEPSGHGYCGLAEPIKMAPR